MSIELENGRTYVGEVDPAMLPNGFGKELYHSGKVLYEGEFHHGQRDGRGIFFYESGQMGYIGEFKSDFMEGQGVLFYQRSGNLLYNGTLKRGNFHQGDFYFENGTISEN